MDNMNILTSNEITQIFGGLGIMCVCYSMYNRSLRKTSLERHETDYCFVFCCKKIPVAYSYGLITSSFVAGFSQFCPLGILLEV